MAKKKKRRNKNTLTDEPIYSQGQVNRMIDLFFDPLKEKHWAFYLLDELAHMLNEQDPEESLYKLLEFTVPEIARELLKAKRRRERG